MESCRKFIDDLHEKYGENDIPQLKITDYFEKYGKSNVCNHVFCIEDGLNYISEDLVFINQNVETLECSLRREKSVLQGLKDLQELWKEEQSKRNQEIKKPIRAAPKPPNSPSSSPRLSPRRKAPPVPLKRGTSDPQNVGLTVKPRMHKIISRDRLSNQDSAVSNGKASVEASPQAPAESKLQHTKPVVHRMKRRGFFRKSARRTAHMEDPDGMGAETSKGGWQVAHAQDKVAWHVTNQRDSVDEETAGVSDESLSASEARMASSVNQLLKTLEQHERSDLAAALLLERDSDSESDDYNSLLDAVYDKRAEEIDDDTASIGSHDSSAEIIEERGEKSDAEASEISDTKSDGSTSPPTVQYSAEEMEQLRTRKLVIDNALSSEEDYLASLKTLVQYMNSLKASVDTPERLAGHQEISVIFGNLPDILEQEEAFVMGLRQRLEDANTYIDLHVGDLFRTKACALDSYSAYLRNHEEAMRTLNRSTQANRRFSDLVKKVKVSKEGDRMPEVNTLSALLHKPITRVQSGTLILSDLLRNTPTQHVDFAPLSVAQEVAGYFYQQFHRMQESPQHDTSAIPPRHLIRSSFLVELWGTQRRLRYICLFNDLLICCKHKILFGKYSLEAKWSVPLANLFVDETDCDSVVNKNEVRQLQSQVVRTRREIRSEQKRLQHDKGNAAKKTSKQLQKLGKRLTREELDLTLASPCLPIKLTDGRETEKQYTLLLASDFERQDWKDTIKILQLKLNRGSVMEPNAVDCALKLLPEVPSTSDFGSVATQPGRDDDVFFGVLNVTVKSLCGLRFKTACRCVLELDSYGHFYTAANTSTSEDAQNPSWEQAFELPLEGASVLRVLIYQHQDKTDILLGKKALMLDRSWLRARNSANHEVQLADLRLSLTTNYVPPEVTLKRIPSKVQKGVFGIKLEKLVSNEGVEIPRVVQYCVAEVEERGLRDVGIYRISGSTAVVNGLKSAFDKSTVAGQKRLLQSDINAVSGLLKLYFRELPESLFTDALYPKLRDASLAEEQAKRQSTLTSLLSELPDANRKTINFIMDHLLLVNTYESVNKMTLNNLATIFGPTLLRPAYEGEASLNATALSALEQVRIMHCLLQHRLTSNPPKPSETDL